MPRASRPGASIKDGELYETLRKKATASSSLRASLTRLLLADEPR